ncbi:YHS domain protein [Rhodobacteraceae bacterium MCCB 386]|nr:YHS domain protein [Roseitranquillus sediminis]
MLCRRTLLLSSLAMPVVAALPVEAGHPPIFAEHGIAIRGADPVAYFTAGGPVAGQISQGVQWDGAVWLFASSENRERFEANPTAYAPRYGGYCAFAVSRGHTAPIDPGAWTIHDGALYLNRTLRERALFRRDIAGNIRRADDNWPDVLG